MINLKESDNHKVIKAKVGDQIDLTLSMNPSTGFLWQSVDTTAGTLDAIQHDPIEKRPKPGSPVNIRFRFTVQQSGHFTLSYARPWAELALPAKWFDIEVQLDK